MWDYCAALIEALQKSKNLPGVLFDPAAITYVYTERSLSIKEGFCSGLKCDSLLAILWTQIQIEWARLCLREV